MCSACSHRGMIPVTEISVLLEKAGYVPGDGEVSKFLHDRGISGEWDQVSGAIDVNIFIKLCHSIGTKQVPQKEAPPPVRPPYVLRA